MDTSRSIEEVPEGAEEGQYGELLANEGCGVHELDGREGEQRISAVDPINSLESSLLVSVIKTEDAARYTTMRVMWCGTRHGVSGRYCRLHDFRETGRKSND
jgi:hypothetical protein